MNLKPLIGGIVAGVAGALVWGGITYATKMEVGWIAWGVGFCVGVAVRYLAGGAEHAGLGVMAAGIAIGSVVLGKFLAVHWLVANVMNTGAPRQVDMVLNYAFVVASARRRRSRCAGRREKGCTTPNPDKTSRRMCSPKPRRSGTRCLPPNRKPSGPPRSRTWMS